MSEISISLKEKCYFTHKNQPVIALKKIKILIKSKQFISIVGPSGCGKTTLMNIIGGLITARDQEILINGELQSEKNSLGYIFQTSRLMPWLSVFENVKLVCKEANVLDAEKKIKNILNNFGLSEFINSYPNSISGGMRRRVAIARAFINYPEVLLMDEPFVSLDQPAAEEMYKTLIEYWEKKPTTVILITHSVREALLLSDRIFFMTKRPGQILLDYKVKSSRNPLKIDNKKVEYEYTNLLKNYPKILKGIKSNA